MPIIKLITDSSQKAVWNRVVNHPLQTWQWGEIKEKEDNQVLRIAIVDDKNQILQAFLFTTHKLYLNKILINYAKGSWPPKAVLQYLKKHFQNKAVFIKLEPEVFLEEAGRYQLPIYRKSWQDSNLNFVLSKSPLFARHTFFIDLGFSEKKLLNLLKSKTRYNINLAKRKGVVVKDETNNPSAFGTFFNLYQQTIRRQNYLGHSRQYHQTVWQIMKESGYARIFTAYYHNQPLCSYTLFFFKNTAYYLYGGSSTKHKEVMASNLLMWEVLIYAKKHGAVIFDLWGALPPNYSQKHPWAGFHRFKQGYGGVHRSYLPTIDLVFAPLSYFCFNLLWFVRLKSLSFFKKFF